MGKRPSARSRCRLRATLSAFVNSAKASRLPATKASCRPTGFSFIVPTDRTASRKTELVDGSGHGPSQARIPRPCGLRAAGRICIECAGRRAGARRGPRRFAAAEEPAERLGPGKAARPVVEVMSHRLALRSMGSSSPWQQSRSNHRLVNRALIFRAFATAVAGEGARGPRVRQHTAPMDRRRDAFRVRARPPGLRLQAERPSHPNGRDRGPRSSCGSRLSRHPRSSPRGGSRRDPQRVRRHRAIALVYVSQVAVRRR